MKKENKRILAYLLITFLISWVAWGIAIFLTSNGYIAFNSIEGQVIHTIAVFGPAIAGLVLMTGKKTPSNIVRYIFGANKKTYWYLIIFVILESLAIGFSSMSFSSEQVLITLPIIFIQNIFIAGGQEELGWRGFLQPAIEDKFKGKKGWLATLIVGVIWSVWHLPLWFIEGSSNSSLAFPIFMVFTIILAYMLACIYKRTKCVAYCAVMHAVSNVLFALFILNVNVVLIVGLLLCLALSIFLYYIPREVTPEVEEEKIQGMQKLYGVARPRNTNTTKKAKKNEN